MKNLIKDLKRVQKSNLSKGLKNEILVKLVDSYINDKKEFALTDVSKRRELLIGLLTMLEKEGANFYRSKEEIVEKYEANL